MGAAIQRWIELRHFRIKSTKKGKEIWQFTAEDWKEGGVKTAEGAFKGGFSGYAIYGLTNAVIFGSGAQAIASELLDS